MMRMMAGPDDFIGPVNLGNPDEFTILELAKLVIEFTGSRSRSVPKGLPGGDPTRRRPDLTLAQSKRGGQPQTPLRAGLEKTIACFRTIRWEEYRAPTP